MRPDGGSFVVLFLFLLSFFKTVFLAVFVEFVSFLLALDSGTRQETEERMRWPVWPTERLA